MPTHFPHSTGRGKKQAKMKIKMKSAGKDPTRALLREAALFGIQGILKFREILIKSQHFTERLARLIRQRICVGVFLVIFHSVKKTKLEFSGPETRSRSPKVVP